MPFTAGQARCNNCNHDNSQPLNHTGLISRDRTQKWGEGEETLQNKFSWQKYLSFYSKFKNNEAEDCFSMMDFRFSYFVSCFKNLFPWTKLCMSHSWRCKSNLDVNGIVTWVFIFQTSWVDRVKPQNSLCNNKGTCESFTWHLPSSQFCWDHHPALCNLLKGLRDSSEETRCNENTKNINGTFIRFHLLLTTENANHHSQVFQSQSNFSLFHFKI